MRFDSKILSLIEQEFPELTSISIQIGDEKLKLKHQSQLTPYVIFKNTLDENRRFIKFYHQANSSYYKLLPFYICLAIYKKAIADLGEELSNSEVEDYQTQIYLKGISGSPHRFVAFDFENDIIKLSPPGADKKSFKLSEFQYFATGYSETQTKLVKSLLAEIERHRIVEDTSVKGLLRNSRYVKRFNLESGVIVITQKNKFKGYLRSIQFNKVKVSDAIHVKEAVWNKQTRNYEYRTISRFKDDSPLILIASYEDIAIDKFQEAFPNLTTVVFDDVDKRGEQLDRAIHRCYDKLKGEAPSLRDVYLIKANENISDYRSDAKEEKDVHYWLTTTQDFSEEEKRIDIHGVPVEQELRHKIALVETELKHLFDIGCLEYVIPIYREFISIKTRLLTFADPEDLQIAVDNFQSKLEYFTTEKLIVSEFVQLGKKIGAMMKELLKLNFNKKTEHLLGIGESMNSFEEVIILSPNLNDVDHQFLSNMMDLKERASFRTIKNISSDSGETKRLIISFGTNYGYASRCWYDKFGDKELLLLDSFEYSIAQRVFSYTQVLVNQITSKVQRSNILNLTEDAIPVVLQERTQQISHDAWENAVNRGTPLIIETPRPTAELDETEALTFHPEPLEGFVRDNISSRAATKNSEGVREFVVVEFEDGGIEPIPAHQSYYLSLDQDIEIAKIEDLRVRAEDLKPDNEIFWFDSGEYLDFIQLIRDSIRAHPDLDLAYSTSEIWRVKLNEMLKKLGDNGYEKMANLMAPYIGWKVVSLTVSNWTSGATMKPHSFEKVLKGIDELIKKNRLFNELKPFESIEEINLQAIRFKSFFQRVPSQIREAIMAIKYGFPVLIEPEFRLVAEKIAADVSIRKVVAIY